jgi:hypothetical protein
MDKAITDAVAQYVQDGTNSWRLAPSRLMAREWPGRPAPQQASEDEDGGQAYELGI